MNEVVKYHNDFNKIQLPSFTEQEQNMLFGILAKMRDKNIEIIKFTPQELLCFSTENLTNRALGCMLGVLKNKFFKADFTILIKDKEKGIGQRTINLFENFTLWFEDKELKRLKSVEMKVNQEFAYLVNEITANFTRFELAEFTALSGKYTKTLYRLLKQYRHTGYFYMEWNEFKRIMDIPNTYAMSDIEKQILKPAIKELTAERNLFDQKRIPFQNLVYKKLKSGGNRISAIVMSFKPQEQESKEPRLESPNKNIELSEYRFKKARIKGIKKEVEIQLVNQLPSGEINILTKDFAKNFASLDDFKNSVKILS